MLFCRVFVNGRGRDVIMEDMKRRIGRGDLKLEREEAVDVCCSFYFFPFFYIS